MKRVSASSETVIRDILWTLAVGDDDMTGSSHLVDDLGMDSLDLAEMWLRIEEEFGIQELDDPDKISDLLTVQQVVAFVDRQRSK